MADRHLPRVAVLKFGGSTFTEPSDYVALAGALRARHVEQGRPLVVVVSAMSGETERLRALLTSVWPAHPTTTSEDLLPVADSVSAHLLCAALSGVGLRAVGVAGVETGFVASTPSASGRLDAVSPVPLNRALAEADLVVLPGGQATSAAGDPAWLGKNSSDVSAVAAAVAVGARECEIFSDVDGVYSADPRVVTGSRLLPALSYSATATMGRYGAKVLHPEAVELAHRHGVLIRCRRNRPPYGCGTVVGPDASDHAAVIVDERSSALRFATGVAAAEAVRELTALGVRALPLPGDESVLLVVGEHRDISALLRDAGLSTGTSAGHPVVEVEGATVRVTLHPDWAEAVRHAVAAHRMLRANSIPR